MKDKELLTREVAEKRMTKYYRMFDGFNTDIISKIAQLNFALPYMDEIRKLKRLIVNRGK